MAKSQELQQLENSIAILVSSLTEFINSQIQTTIRQELAELRRQPADSRHKNAPPPGQIGRNGSVADGPSGVGSKFLTPKQVAERWGWHTESVRRVLRQRQIESVIISRRRLVPIAEVERLEDEGRISRNNG